MAPTKSVLEILLSVAQTQEVLLRRLDKIEVVLGIMDETSPAPPAAALPSETPALRDTEKQIIAMLRTANARMTRPVLLRALERGEKIFSDSTLRNGLERLKWFGFVDNDLNATPPGYGLTSKCPAE